MKLEFPHKSPAIRIVQPLGEFYVTVLPAELLLRVSRSDEIQAQSNPNGVGYQLVGGTQRQLRDRRLSEIADYLDRGDAAFPNAIIIAANYNFDFSLDQDEVEAIYQEDGEEADELSAPVPKKSVRWEIEEEHGRPIIVIPSDEKLAAVIDGQHRLFAFSRTKLERLDMQLICAVFFDLPKPYQAQLFATINSTQKPVDRSLTYELFGYNIAEQPEALWTPDKLAVFLTRKLGTEQNSPLRKRIRIAPKRDALLAIPNNEWSVSTAVVADGIVRLLTSNPKRDSNIMNDPRPQSRSVLLTGPKDKSPLRKIYLDFNDQLIFSLVENYLIACAQAFWEDANDKSFIRKTVGIQALFDILRVYLAPEALARKNITVRFFLKAFDRAREIDFARDEFREAAGAGRTRIRRALSDALSLDQRA